MIWILMLLTLPLPGDYSCLADDHPMGKFVVLFPTRRRDDLESLTTPGGRPGVRLGTFADLRRLLGMLLDRDYEWCARLMLSQFGGRAVARAERRAHNMLLAGNYELHDIWIRVAASTRRIQSNVQAAQEIAA